MIKEKTRVKKDPKLILILFEISPQRIDCFVAVRDGILHVLVEFGISFVESVGLKARIPAEMSWTSRLDYAAVSASNEQFYLFARLTVSKYTKCICCFVFETC